MSVFVAGATGVLGRRVVTLLVEAGEQVSGLARSDTSARRLRELGAEPVAGDLAGAGDRAGADSLAAAVEGHAAVLNLATSIPPLSRAALPGAFAANDRVRGPGSRRLVDAVLAAGIPRYVRESVTMAYPDRGAEWITEAVGLDAPPALGSVVAAEHDTARVTRAGLDAVVLRFGWFVGADTSHTRSQLALARHGFAGVVGPPEAYVASIDADDAARAVVAALTAPPGTYDVVDGTPLTRAELVAAQARVVGRRTLRGVPTRVIALAGPAAEPMTRSQRVSGAAFRAATGWRAAVPDAAEAWERVAAATCAFR